MGTRRKSVTKKRPRGTTRSKGTATKLQPRGGWDPNSVPFKEGQKYLREVYERVGLSHDKVLTSKDSPARRALKLLQTSNVPSGFRKWQLPFSLFKSTNFYVTVGEPEIKVPEHAHVHGAGFRFILEGSLRLSGKELTAGDWFYVPEKARYAYEVGPRGVSLVASYEC